MRKDRVLAYCIVLYHIMGNGKSKWEAGADVGVQYLDGWLATPTAWECVCRNQRHGWTRIIKTKEEEEENIYIYVWRQDENEWPVCTCILGPSPMISTRSWSGGLVVLCSPCLDGFVCIVTGQQWFVFHHQGTREGPAGEWDPNLQPANPIQSPNPISPNQGGKI